MIQVNGSNGSGPLTGLVITRSYLQPLTMLPLANLLISVKNEINIQYLYKEFSLISLIRVKDKKVILHQVVSRAKENIVQLSERVGIKNIMKFWGLKNFILEGVACYLTHFGLRKFKYCFHVNANDSNPHPTLECV